MAEKKLSPAERFKEMLEAAMERDSFHVGAAKVELAEQIYVAMENKGVSEAEFARLLGVSRAYVNKILQGSANLTIESLVKIGRALEAEFKFGFGSVMEAGEGDVLGAPYLSAQVAVKGPSRTTATHHAVKIPKNLKSKKSRRKALPPG